MDYEHYMRKALGQAEEALEAGEFPVGCVLVYRDEIIVSGARQGTIGDLTNETDHAEMVALRRLSQINRKIEPAGITLFTTMEPCMMCLGALILSRVGKIVYAYEDIMGGGTRCDLSLMSPLYKDSKLSIVPKILRRESLALFKTYFADPKITYWQRSLLAEYTLGQ